jgi:hypothetical protein
MVLRIIAGPHPRWQPNLLGGTVGPNLRHTSIVAAPGSSPCHARSSSPPGRPGDGKLTHAETIVDGLEHAPGAFIDLLRRANTGKMLVRI